MRIYEAGYEIDVEALKRMSPSDLKRLEELEKDRALTLLGKKAAEERATTKSLYVYRVPGGEIVTSETEVRHPGWRLQSKRYIYKMRVE